MASSTEDFKAAVEAASNDPGVSFMIDGEDVRTLTELERVAKKKRDYEKALLRARQKATAYWEGKMLEEHANRQEQSRTEVEAGFLHGDTNVRARRFRKETAAALSQELQIDILPHTEVELAADDAKFKGPGALKAEGGRLVCVRFYPFSKA